MSDYFTDAIFKLALESKDFQQLLIDNVTNARPSEDNARPSEDNARPSEDNARPSEDKPTPIEKKMLRLVPTHEVTSATYSHMENVDGALEKWEAFLEEIRALTVGELLDKAKELALALPVTEEDLLDPTMRDTDFDLFFALIVLRHMDLCTDEETRDIEI